jgi:hypothetical protein
MPAKPITLATVRQLFDAFPGVEEGPCYGTPGFRVRGKFLARLWEDGKTLVVKCGYDERDFRMRADPAAFFNTEHYHGYPSVLVRLDVVTKADLQAVLEEAWRRNAPKRLVAELDAKAGTATRSTSSKQRSRTDVRARADRGRRRKSK